MFESKKQQIISKAAFYARLFKQVFVALGFILSSLLVGIFGYHYLESQSWIDALLNASMILGGMGPVNPINTANGKIFASIYALFSGFFSIGLVGFILAPIFHRVLHKFHYDK